MADDANPIRRRNFLMGAGTALAATMAAPAAPARRRQRAGGDFAR